MVKYPFTVSSRKNYELPFWVALLAFYLQGIFLFTNDFFRLQ